MNSVILKKGTRALLEALRPRSLVIAKLRAVVRARPPKATVILRVLPALCARLFSLSRRRNSLLHRHCPALFDAFALFSFDRGAKKGTRALLEALRPRSFGVAELRAVVRARLPKVIVILRVFLLFCFRLFSSSRRLIILPRARE